MSVIDHQFGDAGGGQALDMPDDQRLACGHEEWFGAVVGEWTHAFAPSGGKNHCFHGFGGQGSKRQGYVGFGDWCGRGCTRAR
jgi:hypothetical protein